MFRKRKGKEVRSGSEYVTHSMVACHETEAERQRQGGIQREGDRGIERQKERETERQRQGEIQREGDRGTETERQRELP